jgi:hypothetical protein
MDARQVSGNGGPDRVMIEVVLRGDGSMQITFANGMNIALLSHALRLAGLHMDNMILRSQERTEKIAPASGVPNVTPDHVQKILDRIKGKNGR